MKSALVIGSNGYLGRHLIHLLTESGFATSHADITKDHIDQVRSYVQLNILDENQVSKMSVDFDYIFVLAGKTGTSSGFTDYNSFININEIGLLNILNRVKLENQKARIVFPSTRLVYKGKKNTFLDETSPLLSKTIYAQNKLSCEAYLRMFAQNFDIPYTIYRLCVPYGNNFDDNYSYGTIGFFINRALNGEHIQLYGEGEPKRTFTHIEDVCRYIIESVQLKETMNEIFNIGGNDHLDLKSIAEMIAKRYNVSIEYLQWPAKALILESGDTLFNDQKLQSKIEYNYKYCFENWIKNT